MTPSSRAAPARVWALPGVIGAAVASADQLTKAWAVAALGPEPNQRAIVLIEDWLRLVYTRNTGVAFGLFQGVPQLFTVTSILITAGAIYAYATQLPNRSGWVQAAMGLLVGGAVGNIIDRLRHGYVVDMVSVGWWPVFNLADSAITTGVVMLAGHLIFVGDDGADGQPATPPRDDGLLRELLGRDLET